MPRLTPCRPGSVTPSRSPVPHRSLRRSPNLAAFATLLALLAGAAAPSVAGQVPEPAGPAEPPELPAPDPASLTDAACEAWDGTPSEAREAARPALDALSLCPEGPEAVAGNAPAAEDEAPAPVAEAEEEAQDLQGAATALGEQAEGFVEATLADPLGTPGRAPGFAQALAAWAQGVVAGMQATVEDLLALPAAAGASVGSAASAALEAVAGAGAAAARVTAAATDGAGGAITGAVEGVVQAIGSLLGGADAPARGGDAGAAGDLQRAADAAGPSGALLERLGDAVRIAG